MDAYKLPHTFHELSRVHEFDFFAMFIGNHIGGGLSRRVFEHRLDPSLVIKVQVDAQRFQNQREWELWQACKNDPAGKWLAPCVAVSPSGLFLIQNRTTPVALERIKRLVPRVPKFFTDLKPANWGLLGRRIVCHDYGTSLFETHDGMKRAEWWEP